MPLDAPCLAEEIVSALIVHLLRTGALEERDLLAFDLSPDARHHLKALIVEAAAEPPAGPNLRIVKGEG